MGSVLIDKEIIEMLMSGRAYGLAVWDEFEHNNDVYSREAGKRYAPYLVVFVEVRAFKDGSQIGRRREEFVVRVPYEGWVDYYAIMWEGMRERYRASLRS